MRSFVAAAAALGCVTLGALLVGWPGLALASGVALAVVGFVWAARQTRRQRETMAYDDLSGEERTLSRPLVRLLHEIEEAVERSRQTPLLRSVGPEALAEAQRIVDFAVRLLERRGHLRRAALSAAGASHEIRQLTDSLEAESSEEVRNSIRITLEAKRLEREHADRAHEAVGIIDRHLRQAEAALSELRTRITVVAARTDMESDEPLREALRNARSLTDALDETEALLRS